MAYFTLYIIEVGSKVMMCFLPANVKTCNQNYSSILYSLLLIIIMIDSLQYKLKYFRWIPMFLLSESVLIIQDSVL